MIPVLSVIVMDTLPLISGVFTRIVVSDIVVGVTEIEPN